MAFEISQNFETRGPTVLAVTTAFLVLSSVFVGLRIISRALIVRKFGLDDYCIVAAWIIAFGMSFAICYGTTYGLGRHEVDIPSGWISTLKRAEYAFSVLYNPALMATKTSILVFYMTLSKTHKIFRWSTIITLAVVNLAGVALTVLNIVQCRPIGAAFERRVPNNATCTDIVTLYLSSAPVNIITDLAILILPMPILTGMRLPRKQKIILILTFSFGIFVTVVDVVRVAFLQSAATNRLREITMEQESIGNDSRDANLNDFSWYAGYSFMWSAIEVHVGMMCASVPALKPLVARFLPKMLRDDSLDDRTGMISGLHKRPNDNKTPPQRVPSTIESQQPAPTARNDSQSTQEMDMMEFLTTPDMTQLPARVDRTQTAVTNTTRHTQPVQQTFFDFVNVGEAKSMLHYTHRESVFPFVMVTLLFFVWGFAYGLLDVLNSQFQRIANMSHAQTISIHSSYFGGYLVGPLTFGRLVLKHWGFKACYIVGLIIYGCGTLVFWPSAVLTSFPAFLVSNFIVGAGLSTLEIAANAFIALVGPPRYSESRLNLSQGIQAIGGVLSPLLARKVLFKGGADSLIDVQWTYLGISLFTFLLALAYYYVPLPEATDQEFEDSAERLDGANHAKLFNVKVIWFILGLGVFSQFCYVGGQEVVSTNYGNFMAYVMPSWSTMDQTDFQAIGHTLFAASRFLGAAATMYFKPRHVLLFFYIGSIALTVASMFGRGVTPTALTLVIYFFEGPIFSIIFAMCLRGMGRHTKDASTLLTAAISGGGVFPPIAWAADQDRTAQYSQCVAVAAFAGGMLFVFWTELVPKARKIVDPLDDPATLGSDRERSIGSRSSQDANQPSDEKRNNILDGFKRKVREFKDELPTREHRERRSWPSSPIT